jgi:alpha-1,6-mannosyltransferase
MPRDPAARRRPLPWGRRPVLFAGASSAGTGTAPRTLSIPTPDWLRLRRLAAVAQRPLAGRIALATLVLGTFLVVMYATASQNVLVPRGYLAFPPWDSGPLHYVFKYLPVDQMAINWGFSAVLLILVGAYMVLISAVRTLSMRTIVLTIVGLHLLVLMTPPIQLNDVWNYLGYARLGALHGLNPYTHVIANEVHDPVFRFSSWHNLKSPYGPLFTAMSYPLAFLSLPVAYWVLKVSTMLCSLALIALVYRVARQLGRDPRYALVFLALNPIYVIYAMGGFHNDFFMLVPMLASISFVLSRRDRSAGAVLMLAVAVKFTAGLLLPFLLVGVHGNRRRRDIIIGAVMGGIPMLALQLALFGTHLSNLTDQSTLLTNFSIPELVGLAIGLGGGAPGLLKVASVLVVVTVAWLLWRRRGDWIARAGWGTVALIASLSWLMPWYVIWVLPLAGLGTSVRLRKTAVLLTIFLVVTFMPAWGIVLWSHGLDPMNTAVGHASNRLQNKLAG